MTVANWSLQNNKAVLINMDDDYIPCQKVRKSKLFLNLAVVLSLLVLITITYKIRLESDEYFESRVKNLTSTVIAIVENKNIVLQDVKTLYTPSSAIDFIEVRKRLKKNRPDLLIPGTLQELMKNSLIQYKLPKEITMDSDGPVVVLRY